MVSSEGACAAYFAYGRHLASKSVRTEAKSHEVNELVQIGGDR
jgi:hypothetical protein